MTNKMLTDNVDNVDEEIKKLFELGVHLGHKKNRLHPKVKPFIYKIVNGFAVIDLVKTVQSIKEAKKFLQSSAKEGKKLLVVVTKKVANQFTTDLCQKNDIFYITHKWLPGLLTNFDTIIKNVKKMNLMDQEKAEEAWSKLVKHERLSLEKKLLALKKVYGGIAKMEKKPDLLFIVDIKREKTALAEAKKNNLPMVAILDTNSSPGEVNYPVVANDDSPTSIQYLIRELIEAYISGLSKNKKQ